MKDIVEYIVKQFVSNPDAVEVTETQQDGYLNISLKVAPDDMGLTIGKSGQTIKAIRRLLTIKAITENVRVNLELVDNGVKPEDQKDSAASVDQKSSQPEDSEDKATESSEESDKSDSPSPSESSEESSTNQSAS